MATQAKSRTSSRSHGKSEGGSSSASKRSSSKARSHPGTRSGSRSGGGASTRSKSASSSRKAGALSTTDHEQIRKWVEQRGGKPACVRGTGDKNDTGMLRIDMPGYTGADKLAPISWDEWFEKFDEKNLAFLYQDKTAGGKKSNFNKLVSR
jgi:hypothetical protein